MTAENNTNKHISISEVLTDYSEVLEFLGWDRRTLGTFCQARLLKGKYNNTIKEWILKKSSLDELIEFVLRRWEQSIRKHRAQG